MSSIVEYILRLRDEQFKGGIQSAIQATSELDNHMTSLGSAIGVTFGIAGIAMFTRSMIEAGTTVENAQIGLTTLLKDAGAAKEVISNTMADAATTPFGFEGLLAANQALIAANESAGGARSAVLDLANAIAAVKPVGGDAELQRMVVNLQQIKNTGVATALDIKQFAYAGINIYEALDKAGIEHGENSKITYKQVTDALRVAHEAGGIYFNGLENMSNSTSVQISNLGDEFFKFKVNLFNDLKPAIIETVSAIKNAVKFLDNHRLMIIQSAKAIGVAVTAFIAYKTYVVAATLATEGFAAACAMTPWGAIATGVLLISGAFGYITSGAERSRNAINALRADQDKETVIELEKLKETALQRGEAEAGLTAKISDEYIKRREARNKDLTHSLDVALKAKDSDSWASYLTALPLELMSKLTGGSKEDDAQIIRNELNKNEAAISAAARWGASKATAIDKAKVDNKPPTISKATGSKNVTINISIKDFGAITINATTVKDSVGRITEHMRGALASVLNDSQLIVA